MREAASILRTVIKLSVSPRQQSLGRLLGTPAKVELGRRFGSSLESWGSWKPRNFFLDTRERERATRLTACCLPPKW